MGIDKDDTAATDQIALVRAWPLERGKQPGFQRRTSRGEISFDDKKWQSVESGNEPNYNMEIEQSILWPNT